MVTYQSKYESPIGSLVIGCSEVGLTFIKQMKEDIAEVNDHFFIRNTIEQLDQYFDGKRKQFDIAIDFEGYSTFSVRVWRHLLTIPYSKTISYKQLATALGDPKCIRAAGTANGRNPCPIIVPCHRVIGSDGGLTGFAWGLDIKNDLLKLENPLKFGAFQTKLIF